MKLINPTLESNFEKESFIIELTGREIMLINSALWVITLNDLNDNSAVWAPGNFMDEELTDTSGFLDKVLKAKL